ncbi:hypothetical protein PHAVU_004G099500 [Phaseolus vulgaris]|uniref:Uncharacterized protein n=1 Tax=Phaseolus vulgaris TaxID=3885 RepID=V7C1P2_PHAVU|nr:hypothetical protein PHAVU_004G099500g [Phaseolus vulgaris]ESW24064.1 hypothetical protein PHAVU_004G099500g [Phaseolus vulgaris]
MSSYYLYALLLLLLLFFHASPSVLPFHNTSNLKCNQRERQELLNFKHGLIDNYDMLSTWRNDENNQDCCKWKGIQCNHQTRHVTILSLPGQYPDQYLKGEINITLLFALQNIQHLDLSHNFFLGSHIPQEMGSLTNLRYLSLSYSFFGGGIPTQLGNLTHLLSLDLSYNYLFHGEIPYQFGRLTNLRYLNLSYNYLNGELPYQLANLSQLRYLDLGSNSFSGALPFQIGNLPFLHTLRLAGNFDVKPTDAEWLSKLYYLTNLALYYLHNLDWLQMIIFPNLREFRLVDCSLSDIHIQSLFYSYSNFSTSLTILDLSSNMLTSSTFQLLSNISLNLQELYLSDNNIVLSSPFHSNFPSLVILDLSYNNMTSLVFQTGFNFSSKLQNLHLENCNIRDDSFLMSPISITNSSSSLAFLDLSFNMLKSSSIFHWLINSTTNLRMLYIYGNLLEGPIPDGFGKVMNSLEILSLSGNKLQGEIPSFFGNMCTLQILDLSENKLSGKISNFFQNSSWCNKHRLEGLSLSDNQITGRLPASIGLLSELEVLSLDGNRLEGDITESHLSNFSKLYMLSLSDNSFSLKFGPTWVPPFQLLILELRSCNLGSTFPSWLQTQSSIILLDISKSRLNDSVPYWFWNNLQNMGKLNMSYNNLIGKIPPFLLQASKLKLSKNKFSDLFSFLCDWSTTANLASLDLSNNEIKGKLPNCWKYVDRLLFLDLSNNKLVGKIPASMGSLVNLEALVLRNNNLMGELASTLKNCSNLITLDVSENILSGPIPSWIGEINLCYLKHIQSLDLSRNYLSRGIPTCLKNLTAMSEKIINRSKTLNQIYWSGNLTYYEPYRSFTSNSDNYTLNITWMWKGVEQWFSDPELRLKSIDLSSNSLTGEIPKEIGYLVGLNSLNLSRNNLRGEIPSGIGNLSSLESLDLSRNHISGGIPSSLSQIDGLGKLDLSYNSLSGRIPSGRHFETFDGSSFKGNNDLCGEQVIRSCPGDGDGDGDERREKVGEGEDMNGDEESDWYEALYISMGIGYFTGFWGLLGPILLSRSFRNAYLNFLNRFIDCMYEQCARCQVLLTARKRLFVLRTSD